MKRNVETQRQFVSNASHELRTPLTILRTEFEVAKRADPASLDTVDLLDRGLDEIGRMSRIVDDLLTLSRIDADQETLAFSEVDVAALAERVVERMRTYADDYEVQVSFTRDGGTTLQADADHLERARERGQERGRALATRCHGPRPVRVRPARRPDRGARLGRGHLRGGPGPRLRALLPREGVDLPLAR